GRGESFGIPQAAASLAAQGQQGDTILAHISPREALALKMAGGAGTTNPVTGLPEFFDISRDAAGAGTGGGLGSGGLDDPSRGSSYAGGGIDPAMGDFGSGSLNDVSRGSSWGGGSGLGGQGLGVPDPAMGGYGESGDLGPGETRGGQTAYGAAAEAY